MELSTEQVQELRSQFAKENGSKGGKAWWQKLSEKERQERIKKLTTARKKDKAVDS